MIKKSVENLKIKQTDKAWMAGFIDGEGYIGIDKQIRKDRPSPTYRTAVKVSNTVIESLLFFKKRYGGTISPGSGAYQWACPTMTRKKLVDDVLPFLVIKITQARLVLFYMEHFEIQESAEREMKESFYLKSKILNKNHLKSREHRDKIWRKNAKEK